VAPCRSICGKNEPIPAVATTAIHLRILHQAMPTHRSHVPLSLVVGTNRQATSDGDLARGLAVGEAWAIAETWHRFAPMVLMMAERSLGSRSEADDIGQEVFYCVFRKAPTLREPDSLRSFVYSIAVRALKSDLRRKKVRAWLSFHEPESLVDLGSRTLDVESRDLLRKCYALLDRLTPRDRLVFILRRMESMTVEEIAAAMDLSVSTVKRSMAHASNRLLHWIDADPGLAGLLGEGRWG
jgi:RNA polymerase sigma-70 factor, ECF subfamily